MSERAPYSRVYWSIRDDAKFDTIRGDDHHLATWLRLLIAADMAYPASADVPSSVRRGSVKALVDAGVIDLVAGGMFRVHGLGAERERRKAAATTRGPNGTRTVPGRYPDGDLDETRRDETREPLDRIVDIWLSVKYRLPTERQRAFLFAYLQAFDETGEARAERAILSHPSDPIAAMKDELAAFREERKAALADEVTRPAIRRKPGLPQSARDILAELKLLDAEVPV